MAEANATAGDRIEGKMCAQAKDAPTAEMASVQDKAEVGLAKEATPRRIGAGKGPEWADLVPVLQHVSIEVRATLRRSLGHVYKEAYQRFRENAPHVNGDVFYTNKDLAGVHWAPSKKNTKVMNATKNAVQNMMSEDKCNRSAWATAPSA